MFKVKPIFPCPSIKEQVSYYESLGFTIVQVYTRPNPYAVVSYGPLELHFYGTKRILPQANSQMCYIEVDDVDRVYEQFTAGLKQHTERISRSGIPRISKLKHLVDDRRFTMTDPGGNTFYIGTPNTETNFYRTLESREYAEPFETLYDLLYSKEDTRSANVMLEKFFPAENLTALDVTDIDLAKVLLVALDIQLQQDKTLNRSWHDRLQQLLAAHDTDHPDWNRIESRYEEAIDLDENAPQ